MTATATIYLDLKSLTIADARRQATAECAKFAGHPVDVTMTSGVAITVDASGFGGPESLGAGWHSSWMAEVDR